MSDATLTGRRLQVLANYIIEMGLSVESLQDEILVQLCSQTWLNRDEASVARGWLLAACCLSCFAPSRVLATYLLKYVQLRHFNFFHLICNTFRFRIPVHCVQLFSQNAIVFRSYFYYMEYFRK